MLPHRPRRLCLAALVLLAVGGPGCAREAAAPAGPLHGIVLFGIDTLRADGLSCQGNPRPTTPAICELAARGHLFENAFSNTSWTLPGFIAILSGELPSARIYPGALARSGAERLRDAGYHTAAFTEGGYVSRQLGLALGFETWWEETTSVIYEPGPDNGVARTFGLARDWLREHGREPFFLFVHTYEPHVPYQHLDFAQGLDPGRLGGPYDRTQNTAVLREKIPVGPAERAWVRALYDGGVAATDREVGALLATLAELGVAERTAVVVVSDHGEQLGEHLPRQLGLHGQTLWDTVLHVPLVVHDPRRRDGGRRIAAQVRTVDVMPTILDLAGLAPDVGADGRSLVPLMDGREREDRPAYGELRDQKSGRLRAVTLRTPEYKLHLNTPGEPRPALQLFRVSDDPGEQRDLAEAEPHERQRLHADLQNALAGIEERRAPWTDLQVDPTLRKRLDALGYTDPKSPTDP